MPLTNLLNPPTGTDSWSQFGRGLADGIADTICANEGIIYAGSALAAVSTGGGAAGVAIPAALFTNALCRDRAGQPDNKPMLPASPFQGGQCNAVGYIVDVRWEVLYQGNWYPESTSINSLWGPIQAAYIGDNNSRIITCRGAGLSPGPIGPFYQTYGGGLPCRNFIITALTRIDGNPDNCGNPPIQPPPGATQGPSSPRTFNIPVLFVDGLVDIPITIGPIQPQFNFGPITIPFTINNSPVYLNPDYDIIPGPPPGMKPPEDKPSEESDFEEQDKKSEDILNKLDCIVDSVCQPYDWSVVQTFCDEEKEPVSISNGGYGLAGIVSLVETADSLNDARKKEFCPNEKEQLPPILIGQGVSSESNPITIVSINKEVVSVLLVIDNYDKDRINIYRLGGGGREEGKFGAISSGIAEYGGTTGQPDYVWSKQQYHRCIESKKQRVVKISLRPEVSWKLYDSGER